jgi:hypothetical protein
VTPKIHSVVQDPYNFDRCFGGHPVHQEVTSAPTLSRHMDCAKTWHDLISGFGTRNIGTPGKFANRLNERTLIDTRLSRAKILSGPFDDVRKVEFRGSAESDAPSPLGHSNLSGCLGNDLLRQLVQVGLQVFDISKFFEFAPI